ncbi:MAG: hypothetical protein WBQ25_16040 [Nitrososphaeraceae archaeon]
MVTFDVGIISNCRQISENLLQSRANIKRKLAESTIDPQTRILLEYLSSDSLLMLSLLFKHSIVFMEVLNNDYLTITSYEKLIDSLPTEFYIQKKQLKEEIADLKLKNDSKVESLRERLSELDDISNFTRWEKRYREDEVKDKKDPNAK